MTDATPATAIRVQHAPREIALAQLDDDNLYSDEVFDDFDDLARYMRGLVGGRGGGPVVGDADWLKRNLGQGGRYANLGLADGSAVHIVVEGETR